MHKERSSNGIHRHQILVCFLMRPIWKARQVHIKFSVVGKLIPSKLRQLLTWRTARTKAFNHSITFHGVRTTNFGTCMNPLMRYTSRTKHQTTWSKPFTRTHFYHQQRVKCTARPQWLPRINSERQSLDDPMLMKLETSFRSIVQWVLFLLWTSRWVAELIQYQAASFNSHKKRQHQLSRVVNSALTKLKAMQLTPQKPMSTWIKESPKRYAKWSDQPMAIFDRVIIRLSRSEATMRRIVGTCQIKEQRLNNAHTCTHKKQHQSRSTK